MCFVSVSLESEGSAPSHIMVLVQHAVCFVSVSLESEGPAPSHALCFVSVCLESEGPAPSHALCFVSVCLESEGPAPSHVVVMCKGHVFSMQCVDEAGAPFTAPEYESQLQKIVDRASSLPPAPGVGYFTSLERTKWAQVGTTGVIGCTPSPVT